MTDSLDGTDLRILGFLQDYARMTNAALAKKLGMAPSAVLERVKKLEQKQAIQAYCTRINPEALNLRLLAFIFMKSSEGSRSLETGRRLARIPGVLELHQIAGEDCFIMKVRSRDPKSLVVFLREKVGRIPGIISTKTTIVLETFSENNLMPVAGTTNGK